ncbi:MAG: 1-acyl-sn-glycerol-3-phosphate acyltransferase [Halieaceae bacterium]|nr:1-acyl-sn-glycerol-3-phosphate acyltransferase [Halieaceae bacterium]
MSKPESLTDKLSVSPWPDTAGHVIFLVDGNNGYEEQLLKRWINQHQADQTSVTIVTLQLGDHRGPLKAAPLEKALQAHPDATVAPVRVSWLRPRTSTRRRPRLIDLLRGTDRRPPSLLAGSLAKRDPSRIHLIAGTPDSAENLRQRFFNKYQHNAAEQPADFAIFVARQAAVVLDMGERQLQGGRYKVPRYVSQSLRKNRDLRTRLSAIALDRGVDRSTVNKELNEYLKEMVSHPSPFWLDVWVWFCSFCLGLAYEPRIRYRPEEIEAIRSAVRNYPSVLLFTHKTYLDGFVVPKIMFDNDFPMPHFFGGANLKIPGLGFLLPRAGGIFLRRSFQDNEVYKTTMRQYIAYLMEKRFPLTWSFEGTRSRLGKLMPPKYGLLKYVLEATHDSGAQNLHIIPVTVSYDLVRDAEEYAREQSGVPKAPESLRWLIGYIRSLARPMGKIYVDFGKPVVLPTVPPPDEKLALEKIAFQVAVEANRVAPITLPALVSMSLLGRYPRALTANEVTVAVSALVHWCEARQLRLSPDFDRDYARNMRSQLQLMIDEGIISQFEGGTETVYGIIEGQAPVASYYRNTIVHFFVNKAITELALLEVSSRDCDAAECVEVFWSEVEALRDLFKFEFFYPPSDVFRLEIEAELSDAAQDWQAILESGPAGARQLLEQLMPHVAHMTLQMFAEAYSVAADVMVMRPDVLDKQDEFVELCMRYGKQAYLQGRVSSDASVGLLLFKNAWKLFSSRELIRESLPDFESQRIAQANNLSRLVRRIEYSRASSIASSGAETMRDAARGAL